MPIPLPPNADGGIPAPHPVPAPQAQHAPTDAGVRPALAAALPPWDLLPPQQVLAFRRRA